MISAGANSISNATQALRKKIDAPISKTVIAEFETEYNCTCYVDGRLGHLKHIEFATDREELAFILRWS